MRTGRELTIAVVLPSLRNSYKLGHKRLVSRSCSQLVGSALWAGRIATDSTLVLGWRRLLATCLVARLHTQAALSCSPYSAQLSGCGRDISPHAWPVP